ncbi:MAG: ATP-binding protein [Myxococcota bacterium]|nr:ATP-binding protein [Myxococcota bacterium]
MSDNERSNKAGNGRSVKLTQSKLLSPNVRSQLRYGELAAQQIEWSEDMLDALPPQEHDYQEFKGSGWLLKGPHEIQSDFLFYLSKQISAFANGSGGRIFVGIDDRGCIDGGIPVDLKGGGTRAWLEDMIAVCVDPKPQQYNVFEVLPRERESRIQPNHAVYILELSSSPDAPHQAKDHRYYLRIAGKSRPMGHVHVQDVLRRTFHPTVLVSRFGPYGSADVDDSDPRGRRIFLSFRTFIQNNGRTLARHVGFEAVVPRPLAGREVRSRMESLAETHYTQTPGELSFFRYHPTPLFPSQEVYAATTWLCIHRGNIASLRSGLCIRLITYADDARPQIVHRNLMDYSLIQKAVNDLEDHT